MKVAISLPDPLFAAAEQLAEHLRMSRSQLYAMALAEYVRSRESQSITERLNAVYRDEPGDLDPALMAAQMQHLDNEAW